jgi:hypothetical protein
MRLRAKEQQADYDYEIPRNEPNVIPQNPPNEADFTYHGLPDAHHFAAVRSSVEVYRPQNRLSIRRRPEMGETLTYQLLPDALRTAVPIRTSTFSAERVSSMSIKEMQVQATIETPMSKALTMYKGVVKKKTWAMVGRRRGGLKQ